MVLNEFTGTNGKLVSINMNSVTAYKSTSATTIQVFCGAISYNLTITAAAFALLLVANSPYTFGEFNLPTSGKINLRIDAIDSFTATSEATTTVVVSGVSYGIAIAYATFVTVLASAPALTLLAASTQTVLTDFINNSTPQSKNLVFQLDRKSETIGAFNIVATPASTPTGFTIASVNVDSTDQIGTVVIDYAGTGAAVATHDIVFQFKVGDVILCTVTVPVSVAAMSLAKEDNKKDNKTV